jgi:hypothetical protein
MWRKDAMAEETIESVEITLDDVLTDKPETEAPAEETPAEAGERLRDDKGRFAAAEEPEPVVETPREEKPELHIPSWRLKEEADHRREAERRAAQLESMLAQYEQRLQAMQPKPEPEQFPDIFAQPEALPQYFQSMLQREREQMKAEMRAVVANVSLQRAHDKYGDAFSAAYKEILSRPIDDPMRQQVINSPDPGNELVSLYQREQTYREVGSDPQAYREKVKAELLQDKEFLAQAIEAAKGVASAQPTQKIEMPPSLNKASAARSNAPADVNYGRHMYNFATR